MFYVSILLSSKTVAAVYKIFICIWCFYIPVLNISGRAIEVKM